MTPILQRADQVLMVLFAAAFGVLAVVMSASDAAPVEGVGASFLTFLGA